MFTPVGDGLTCSRDDPYGGRRGQVEDNSRSGGTVPTPDPARGGSHHPPALQNPPVNSPSRLAMPGF